MSFRLCASCASRFMEPGPIAPAGSDTECHICRGALSQLPRLADEAVLRSGGFEWLTFSVASSFGSKTFVREEEVAGFFAPGQFTSLKNRVNSELAEKIAAKTGKKNAQRGADAAFEFDFANGKCSANPSQLYLFGRYNKLSRKHCQSRWHCSSCHGRGCEQCMGSGQNYPSVEDEIGKAVLPLFEASGCVLHASGREDVDVRMLGNGRPFVMEIMSPKRRNVDASEIERRLSGNPHVRASGLRLVAQGMVDAVCNSHFDKEYSALVSADRPFALEDVKLAESLSGKKLLQQTPTRVLARRADLERERRVHSVSAELCEGGRMRLRIFAEAGTYIKEFIHSDSGRTRPSLSEILGCRASCDELDVTGISSYFLETVSY
ncbi:tRNA pseudouridine synthase Pus10 [uncultured archaeon]|nr:tRNA pseudouridine synthase Pus10 [uncultured archaeon]